MSVISIHAIFGEKSDTRYPELQFIKLLKKVFREIKITAIIGAVPFIRPKTERAVNFIGFVRRVNRNYILPAKVAIAPI